MALSEDKLLRLLIHPAALQTLMEQEFQTQQAQRDSAHDPDHTLKSIVQYKLSFQDKTVDMFILILFLLLGEILPLRKIKTSFARH